MSAQTIRRVSLLVIVVLIALAAAGYCGYRFLTRHSFSAREKPTAFEAYLARHARRLAVPPGVKEMMDPYSAEPMRLAKARDHFADHCAACHANNGSGDTFIGRNMYPPAPDMRTSDTQELSDGEIFFIIKNGIRFTGMPGWGGEDEENWGLVQFIRHLPHLTEEELKFMHEVNQQEIKGAP